MIRRYAATLRLLLMLTDGFLAAAVLVSLSIVRFGENWAVWWREIIPDPVALLVVYSVGWVVALSLNGLYRPTGTLVHPDRGLGPGAGDRAHGRGDLRRPLLVQAAGGQPPLPAHPLPDAVRWSPSSRGPSCGSPSGISARGA